MKIKLLQNIIHAGLILAKGAVHELEDPQAQALLKRGLAAEFKRISAGDLPTAPGTPTPPAK
jgi:hypothetical protein